ncbi:hypothetical protein M2145_001384 [Lachnospiraceae bacterium PF1-21]|uniref:Thiol-activated cytolysin n=1 Tax=Ohessyouella blattaphilus TaxID=2949333 RepID=A0ABT1EKE4_9FIRM|nr:thiol-activated cytolysin family protein [Ohessyouella blattaphilus]MCP1111179.1 thiol-activated cytolysin family protein [Ohessyouella blattaphilus]MCR8564573.1 thiol-activated cytolysin family protein [Ohessyouella blattaphilus]
MKNQKIKRFLASMLLGVITMTMVPLSTVQMVTKAAEEEQDQGEHVEVKYERTDYDYLNIALGRMAMDDLATTPDWEQGKVLDMLGSVEDSEKVSTTIENVNELGAAANEVLNEGQEILGDSLDVVTLFDSSREVSSQYWNRLESAGSASEKQAILTEYRESVINLTNSPMEHSFIFADRLVNEDLFVKVDQVIAASGKSEEEQGQLQSNVRIAYIGELTRSFTLSKLAYLDMLQTEGENEDATNGLNAIAQYAHQLSNYASNTWPESEQGYINQELLKLGEESDEKTPEELAELQAVVDANYVEGGLAGLGETTEGETVDYGLSDIKYETVGRRDDKKKEEERRKEEARKKAINEYVKGLDYDDKAALARKGESIETYKKKDGTMKGSEWVVSKREKKSINQRNADVAAIAINTSDIYPGAMFQANSNLVDGKGTMISVSERNPISVHINLPGLSAEQSTREVKNPNAATINGAINSILDEFYKTGRDVPANMSTEKTMIYSKKQLEAHLGLQYEAVNKFNLDFDMLAKGEKKVMLANFHQTYYTAQILIENQANPADYFGQKTNADELKGKMDAKNPPVIVGSVAYGRSIVVKLETSSSETEVKLAFEAAMSGKSIDANSKYAEILKNTSFSSYVFGGSAGAAGRYATHDNLKEVQELIVRESKFGKDTPAAPLAYQPIFIKDNHKGEVTGTTEYVETTTEVFKSSKMGISNDGKYYAVYSVRYKPIIGYRDDGSEILGEEVVVINKVHVGSDWENWNMPANIGDVYVGFDIKAGSTWPFSKWLHKVGRSYAVVTNGYSLDSSIVIRLDGQKIVQEDL